MFSVVFSVQISWYWSDVVYFSFGVFVSVIFIVDVVQMVYEFQCLFVGFKICLLDVDMFFCVFGEDDMVF